MTCKCGRHRTPQGCQGAEVLKRLTPEQLSRNGKRGRARLNWKQRMEQRIAALEARAKVDA